MNIKQKLIITIVALLLSACGGSNNNGSRVDLTPEFDAFALNLVQNKTSNTAEAANINRFEFQFNSEGAEDETFFDELF